MAEFAGVAYRDHLPAGLHHGAPIHPEKQDVRMHLAQHLLQPAVYQRERVLTAAILSALVKSVTYSSVIGVARTGQMRRDFLSYIERERAHPYRTFLHYNSWYDLGRFNPYDKAGALDRINFFGRELHEKRGVTLDSYLFDDGWDNHATVWSFNKGFPDGFTNVRKAAEKYGAGPGVWMSPWGGYADPKKERIEFGRQQGFEVVDNGFALSGPKYYARFREVCLEMIRKCGVSQFKFDGKRATPTRCLRAAHLIATSPPRFI
jgi:hypothetical protein